jgi:hypothetical protein
LSAIDFVSVAVEPVKPLAQGNEYDVEPEIGDGATVLAYVSGGCERASNSSAERTRL